MMCKLSVSQQVSSTLQCLPRAVDTNTHMRALSNVDCKAESASQSLWTLRLLDAIPNSEQQTQAAATVHPKSIVAEAAKLVHLQLVQVQLFYACGRLALHKVTVARYGRISSLCATGASGATAGRILAWQSAEIAVNLVRCDEWNPARKAEFRCCRSSQHVANCLLTISRLSLASEEPGSQISHLLPSVSAAKSGKVCSTAGRAAGPTL